jgi:hypothetical protein
MDDKINNFLEELTQLSLKHNIIIGGCGCCNSPYLKDTINGEFIEGKHHTDRLVWIKRKNKYHFSC